MKEKKIEIIRNKVDQIDNQIIQLIIQRLELAEEIGKIKLFLNKKIFDEKREKKIINRLYDDFKGFIKKDEIRSLFVQIYKISRKRQIESNKSFEKGDS